MKKNLLLFLALMLTVSAFAQISFVDVTTRSTNTISSGSAFTLITIPGVCTNAPYSTTNSQYILIGDPLPTAFGKVNTDFAYLASAVRTNGATANGQIFIYSNGIAGGGYWANFTVTGGQPASATLSNIVNQVSTPINLGGATNSHLLKSITIPSGGTVAYTQNSDGSSNAALTITSGGTSSNSIASTNGIGRGTTLIAASSIGVTNLSVTSDTFLNNSNLHIFHTGLNIGPLIPLMTGSNTPSGNATASSYYTVSFSPNTAYYPWCAFSGPLNFQTNFDSHAGGNWQNTGNDNWLQYNFDKPVTVVSNSFYYGTSSTQPIYIQASFDGITWATIFTNTITSDGINPTGINLTNITASYFRWGFHLSGFGNGGYFSNQLYGIMAPAENIVSSNLLSITSPNGVGINVTSLITNTDGTVSTLNVGGSINATAFYKNGSPLAAGFYINPYPGINQINATNNGTGIFTNINSIFYLAPGSSFEPASTYSYTNQFGWTITPSTVSGVGFSLPAFSLIYITNGITTLDLTNSTLFGTYGNFKGASNVTAIVYFDTNAPPFSPSSYLIAGNGGNRDAGLQTNIFSKPFSITRSTTTTITNNLGRARWNVKLQFIDAATGSPAFAFSLPGISTNTIAPLPLGTSTTTNFYSFDVNPNTTNSITDVSNGSGASVTVLDSFLTQPPN